MSTPSNAFSAEEPQKPEREEIGASPPDKEPAAQKQAEAELPPEAQGETNGGPLGCCLGTIIGLFLTFLLITAVSLLLSNGGFLGFATLPVAIVGAIVGGYFGWKIGKKLYREYEPPVVKDRRRPPKQKAKPERV